LGKIYKVLQLSKLTNLLQIFQTKSVNLKIDIGFERIIVMALNIIALIHFSACIWVMIAKFDETSMNNWICMKGLQDARRSKTYVTALYFTTTTILTVGYGDISAYNMPEQIFCIFLMCVGGFSYSFTTGILSSVISSSDSSEAILNEKI
jgi:Trk-type K+ transport system membrane component